MGCNGFGSESCTHCGGCNYPSENGTVCTQCGAYFNGEASCWFCGQERPLRDRPYSDLSFEEFRQLCTEDDGECCRLYDYGQYFVRYYNDPNGQYFFQPEELGNQR